MSARWKSLLFVLILIPTALCLLSRLLPERLQIYGLVQEGRLLPERLRSLHGQISGEAPDKKYIAYYVPRAAEVICDCAKAEEVVAHSGGKLEVVDSKISKYFGVPLIHNGLSYQNGDSLLIMVDNQGEVLSIHRGVSTAHLVLGFATQGWLNRGSEFVLRRWNKAFVTVAMAIGNPG